MKQTTLKASILVSALMLVLLPTVSYADAINRQLETGMSGSDISMMQTFFAKDATIYPQGLITGYFGFLTKSAVANFQTRNGIASVGRVGPATLPVLNAQIAAGTVVTSGAAAPMITGVNVNLGTNYASVSWNTNEYAKGVVYYSTSPLITYERVNSVDVSGNIAMTDESMRTSQTVSIQNLQSNTTYYYMIYTTDQSGNVSVTWPAMFHTNQ